MNVRLLDETVSMIERLLDTGELPGTEDVIGNLREKANKIIDELREEIAEASITDERLLVRYDEDNRAKGGKWSKWFVQCGCGDLLDLRDNAAEIDAGRCNNCAAGSDEPDAVTSRNPELDVAVGILSVVLNSHPAVRSVLRDRAGDLEVGVEMVSPTLTLRVDVREQPF